MTNEELIKTARHCGENRSCKECLASEKWGFGCFNFVLRSISDALELATKERDTLLNDLTKASDNCKQDGVFGVCFCCKKRNSCYYLGTSSEDTVCEFEWSGSAGIITSVPVADVKPVAHGAWERKSVKLTSPSGIGWYSTHSMMVQCSECGYTGDTETNYCPWCGAKMVD